MSSQTNNPQPQRLLRIFLCHSSDDKPAVRDLYHKLINDGFDPWLDEEALIAGQDWEGEIVKAVRSSDVVLICLSKKSISKTGYVQKEIKFALDVADMQPESAIFIIPLKLEDCDIPKRLSLVQWINLFDKRGYERLVKALNYRAGTLGITNPNAIHVNAYPVSLQDSIRGTETNKHKEEPSVGNTNTGEQVAYQSHDSLAFFFKILGQLKRAPRYLIWITALTLIAGGAVFTSFIASRNKPLPPINDNAASRNKTLPPINDNAATRNEPLPPAADIAATVNGKPILLSTVDTVINKQIKNLKLKPLSPAMLRATRLQVLTPLIEQELLLQHAEKEGLLPTENEITQKINEVKAQSLTEEEYQKTLREAGLTEQSIHTEARWDLALQKIRGKLANQINVSDTEVEEFYNQNKEKFFVRRGVGLSDIVSDPADNSMTDDAKNATEAKQKIYRIYQALKDGADFASEARTSSEDPSNASGGDIGFATLADLKKTNFPPSLIKALFNRLQIGDITEPIRFDSGRWYIFKLTERHLKDEKLTLDSPSVRDEIKKNLIEEHKKQLETELIETLKNSATIVNYLAAKPSSH